MIYYTIVYPGEFGQHIQETWSEDQIIKHYFLEWSNKMKLKHPNKINKENCINDWVILHYATKTNQFGEKL